VEGGGASKSEVFCDTPPFFDAATFDAAAEGATSSTLGFVAEELLSEVEMTIAPSKTSTAPPPTTQAMMANRFADPPAAALLDPDGLASGAARRSWLAARDTGMAAAAT
jgi:hypothetical protein